MAPAILPDRSFREARLKLHKWLPTAMSTTCPLLLFACADSPSTPPSTPIPTTVILSTNTASFTYLGETLQVNATVNDQNGAALNTAVSWTVADSAIATVSATGMITARRDGSTTVRATAGNAGANVVVAVGQQPSTLAVSTNTVNLVGFGAVLPVTATVRDAGGSAVTNASIVWTSLNNAVATVSSNGTITSVGLGATEVTAVTGALTARIAVSVAAAAIQINTPPGMQTMIRGANVRFALTAQTAGVRWSSNNPAVATIDSVTGMVHTVAEGVVTFNATAPGAAGAWTRNVVRIRRMQIDPYLATPIAGALWEVPVILIEYHPTADAANLDVLRAPDFWVTGPMSLDSLERLTLRYAKRRKMMVEQGSRFHGYRDPNAQPSLGYRVVEHLIVYDQIPPHPTKRDMRTAGNPRYEGAGTRPSPICS